MTSKRTTQRFCSSCKTKKELTCFPRNKNKYLGYGHTCKICNRKKLFDYNRTEVGLIRQVYRGHKRIAKERHNSEVGYDVQWLEEFMYSNNFQAMFDEWKQSGYDKWYKPSIDRIDDHGTYTKDNIQLMTFRDNWEKSIDDKVIGNTNKQNKSVLGHYPTGEVVEFHSISEASRITGADTKNIKYCCDKKPKYKTAKGIKWEWN